MPLFAQNTIAAMSHTVLTVCNRKRFGTSGGRRERSLFVPLNNSWKKSTTVILYVWSCVEWQERSSHQLWFYYYCVISASHFSFILVLNRITRHRKEAFFLFIFSPLNVCAPLWTTLCSYLSVCENRGVLADTVHVSMLYHRITCKQHAISGTFYTSRLHSLSSAMRNDTCKG